MNIKLNEESDKSVFLLQFNSCDTCVLGCFGEWQCWFWNQRCQ